MADWLTAAHLTRHFALHGHEVGARSVAAYDASAQHTLMVGTYFTYFDTGAGEEREGCFDAATGRFVAQTINTGLIVSHFVTDERYIRRLPYNNYDE